MRLQKRPADNNIKKKKEKGKIAPAAGMAVTFRSLSNPGTDPD
jgi:hypothetical protein